jgi:hypothetical protein
LYYHHWIYHSRHSSANLARQIYRIPYVAFYDGANNGDASVMHLP